MGKSLSDIFDVRSIRLDFDALDKKPVHIVFLLATSERAEEIHAILSQVHL